MHLLLISFFTLIISWIVIIFGLYFSIKGKEAGKKGKCKFFYFISVIGEMFEKISWYMILISIALIISKMIGY